MTKNLRKFKASLVGLIILVSIFVMLASSFCVSAGAIERGTIIVIEKKGSTNLTLSPGDPVIFDFDVTYKLTPMIPGTNFLYIPPTTVHLDVTGDEEEWITATLDRSTLQMEPDEPQRVFLTVSVTPEAPYIRDHEIKIKATADPNPVNWAGSEADISVTVTPQFLYFVGAYAESNYAQVSPPGSYKFPITVVNDATYTVKFYFETNDIPEGWAITPPNSVPVSGGSERKVDLTVTPPYDFGQHDETIGFTIDVYAEPFPAPRGDSYGLAKVDNLNFQVKNFGFSLVISGAGIFFVFGIIAVIVIIMIVFFRYKSQNGKMLEKKKTLEKKK